MRYWPSAVLLASALWVAACGNGRQSVAVAAPNFELKDLSGKIVRLEEFRGRPVFVDFWATWCGPCRLSIPFVQEFYKRHKDDGLVVLGMNLDEDPSGVYAFVKRFQLTYPVLFAGGSPVLGDYEVDGIPLFVFIDREGQIVRRYQGFNYAMIDAWEDDLKTLLGQTR